MGQSSNPAIILKSVSKRFALSVGKPLSLRARREQQSFFWALRDISLEVERGRMVGVIGTNGSGKSTLLNLIGRIVTPTLGQVTCHGRVAALLELGTGFHPELTGRENIYLNGSLLGFSRSDTRDRLEEIIDFANLGLFIDTQLRHFSSGMQVRLGFAIATSFEPDILLVDEVLAVGDAAFQAKCLNRIQEMREYGTTILLVSHALDVVQDHCNEVIWLDMGQLAAMGPARQTIGAYLARVWSADGAVQEQRLGRRWGSGEARINEVRFLDLDGQQRESFETGETMVVEIDYIATTPLDGAVFGIVVHGRDGSQIGESKTLHTGSWPQQLVGEGRIHCTLELPLLPDRYLLTATIYDRHLVQPYDHREQQFSFQVASSPFPERHGLIRFSGRWTSPAAR